MAIESTSVSKPVVRSAETGNRAGLWNSTQGSAAGGKDGPLASIWEKTIYGAQKLLGLDSSKQREHDEKNQDDRGEGARANSKPDTTFERVATAPGFSARGLGRFGLGSSSLDAFSGLRRDTGSRSEGESSEIQAGIASSSRASESAPAQDRQNASSTAETNGDQEKSRLQESEEDDEKARKNRSVAAQATASAAAPTSPLAARAATATQSRQTPESLQPVAAEPTVAKPAQGTAIKAVPEAATPDNLATASAADRSASAQPSARAPEGIAMPVAPRPDAPATQSASAPQEASPASVTTASQIQQSQSAISEGHSAMPKQAQSAVSNAVGNAPTNPTASQSPAATADTQLTPSTRVSEGQAKSIAAEPHQASASPRAGEGMVKTAEDSLAFETGRAKESISSALRGANVGRAESAQPQQSPTSTPAGTQLNGQAGSESTTSADRQASRSSDPTNPQPSDLSKKDEAASHARPAQGTRSSGAEATIATRSTASIAGDQHAQDAQSAGQKANAANNASAASQFARELRADVPRPLNTLGINKPVGASHTGNASVSSVAGVASAGGAVGASGAQPQSGQSDSSGFGQREFASNPSAAQAVKGAEKSSADLDGQAFDVKQSTGDTRRAQATAKTQTTSYVSKTADELKEVVETMTKSIDRLVTNRQGVMNVRISFEQGGSLTLRISMENGQVNTHMQTDVAGLEGAIKSSWSELANEWNQRGLKLNSPQFAEGANPSGDEGDSDSWKEFQQQRQGRQSGADGLPGQGFRGRGQPSGSPASSHSSRGGSADTDAASAAAADPSSHAPTAAVSNGELKTYA